MVFWNDVNGGMLPRNLVGVVAAGTVRADQRDKRAKELAKVVEKATIASATNFIHKRKAGRKAAKSERRYVGVCVGVTGLRLRLALRSSEGLRGEVQ